METVISSPVRVARSGKRKTEPTTLKAYRTLFRILGRIFPSTTARVALSLFVTPRKKAPKVLPDIFEDAHILGVPYKGGKVRVFMWGYTGKLILLVHGWESGGWAYEKIIPELVASGYRVVAVEGPAHGESKLKQTNMIDFGDALQAVIQRLEPSGGVSAAIGHSFGGSTLVQLFTRYGQPKTLKRLVLIATPVDIEMVFKRYFTFIRLPERASLKFIENIENIFNIKVDEMKLTVWKKQLNFKQVLLIHDTQDKVVPFDEAALLEKQWPQAKLLVTENMGHNYLLKNSSVIQRIVDYIKGDAAIH